MVTITCIKITGDFCIMLFFGVQKPWYPLIKANKVMCKVQVWHISLCLKLQPCDPSCSMLQGRLGHDLEQFGLLILIIINIFKLELLPC